MKAIVLSSHYHTPHNLRHRHPEVHITLGPEERVEAVIAAASEQRGEGRLEGEGPRPRQPRADHPQPLRPRQALLLLDVVERLLEVLRRDVQCLQWLRYTGQCKPPCPERISTLASMFMKVVTTVTVTCRRAS